MQGIEDAIDDFDGRVTSQADREEHHGEHGAARGVVVEGPVLEEQADHRLTQHHEPDTGRNGQKQDHAQRQMKDLLELRATIECAGL